MTHGWVTTDTDDTYGPNQAGARTISVNRVPGAVSSVLCVGWVEITRVFLYVSAI